MPLETILKTSKALCDETRLGIFRFLTTRRGPVSVSEVARQFSLHPNAARSHLAKLEDAGLASSSRARDSSSGRPPRIYRAEVRGMVPIFEPAAFKALSVLLLDLIEELPGLGPERVEAFGRRWGRSYAARWSQEGSVEEMSPSYIMAGLVRTMETWGFVASLKEEPKPEVQVLRCPYQELARSHPRTVCPLVHGVLDGMLGVVRPDLGFRFDQRVGREAEHEHEHEEGPCRVRLEEGREGGAREPRSQ